MTGLTHEKLMVDRTWNRNSDFCLDSASVQCLCDICVMLTSDGYNDLEFEGGIPDIIKGIG